MGARYAELHCASNFTFLEGASHPEDLVRRAGELELAAIALTDRDGLYGAVRFETSAARSGVEAIVGCELTVEDGSHLVILVADEHGYANCCELISRAQLRGKKGDARLHFDDLEGRSDGLFALSGGAQGTVETALARGDRREACAIAERLRGIFGERFYLELQHHLTPEETERNEHVIGIARALRLPYVATNGVVYAGKDDALLADILRCIKQTISLDRARAEQRLRPNAEYHLKSARAMARLFHAYPEALDATLVIAEQCRFRLQQLRGQFPHFPVPDGFTRQEYLRMLVYRGAERRYPTPFTQAVEKQLKHELAVIEKLDLAGYFLIVWDIVRAAAELGVLAQGRGSAANSAVCYALGITAVDPISMDLLFERFMSEERQEIPDIDIDFAHQDREKVIQYVYERYGRTNAAMAAEVITYGARSAIRDVGKALGLTLTQVDTIAREFEAVESIAEACSIPELAEIPAVTIQRLHDFCTRIADFPRHMGIHSGGMIITRDPLVRVAPVEWATMHDRTIVQWDKDDLQELGLIKIDLLGLGMLSLLREAFTLYQRCHPAAQPLALHTIPANDPQTYAMMQQADTIGVFQIESRAQQSMLPRMKPTCFYDIVMQVAIIRPGPIQGQMIHPFLRRRSGREAVTYPHPKLEPILKRTLGVPLFQEQGMRMAIETGGFTPGEADQLRRAMGHKRSHERMRDIYPRLVAGMVRNGIAQSSAERLFHMLEGFADYGFPESHAASFALLAYASAYVKCHYPAIFAAAILNVQPMGFYSSEVLVNDAKRHGVEVRPITVNASTYWSRVEPDGALRLGFHLVRGLGASQRRTLEEALAGGAFSDVLDFIRRTRLKRNAVENLAVAGAFTPWFASRREAMWALRAIDEREARGDLGRLMEIDEPAVTFAPILPKEETAFDLWSTGVTSRGQAIEHFRTQLNAEGVTVAARLGEIPINGCCRVGGMVITRQRPQTAKGFVFLTIEDETGLVNVIVRPDVYLHYRRLIHNASILIVEGRLQREDAAIDILAQKLWSLSDDGILAGVQSHDFH